MQSYYGVRYSGGNVIEFSTIYGNNDFIEVGEISRISTSDIKGGYCVYIYQKGIENPICSMPNIGDDIEKVKRITDIIMCAVNSHSKSII